MAPFINSNLGMLLVFIVTVYYLVLYIVGPTHCVISAQAILPHHAYRRSAEGLVHARGNPNPDS